jgi:hypothetical protein
VERTRKADGEIVSLLKTGSAFHFSYLGAVAIAEVNLKVKKRIFSCCFYLEGIVFIEKQEIKTKKSGVNLQKHPSSKAS